MHDFFIAKLHAFGFDLKFLRVIHAYLNKRIQVTKVGSFYTKILQIIYVVSQGSILGPLSFNVNLIDLFQAEHYKSDFSIYVDDTTLYNCNSTFLETISGLQITLDNLFNRFYYNNFEVNASKCDLFFSPFDGKCINFKSSVIEGSYSEKFLGITVDSNFTFEKHMNESCKKGNLKLNALTRCSKFMSTEKRRLMFKAFIISQFSYCPLVWMFHTKQLNNRINSLHEKALRVRYQVRNSSFSELLNLDKSISIHYKNMKYLLTEIYKVKMGILPPIMSDIFSLYENSSYNLSSGVTVNRRNLRTSKFSFETVSTIGAILWNDLPAELKNAERLKTKDEDLEPK